MSRKWGLLLMGLAVLGAALLENVVASSPDEPPRFELSIIVNSEEPVYAYRFQQYVDGRPGGMFQRSTGRPLKAGDVIHVTAGSGFFAHMTSRVEEELSVVLEDDCRMTCAKPVFMGRSGSAVYSLEGNRERGFVLLPYVPLEG